MVRKHYKKLLTLFLILILSLSMIGCYRRIPEPTPQGPDDQVVKLVRQFNKMTHMGGSSLFSAWKPIRELGDSGDPRAVEPLITVLEDTQFKFVRWHAAAGLGKLGDRGAIEPLRRMLKDPLVAWLAAEALAEIGDASAVPHLIEVMEEGHWKSKASVAWGSRFFKDPRIVNALIDCLNDQRWEVRSNAAGSLGEINDPKAIYPLIDSLDDDHWQVRLSAAKSLGNLAGSQPVEPLIDAIKSEWDKRYEIRIKQFMHFFAGFPIDAYQPPSITTTSMIDLWLIGADGHSTSTFMVEKYALWNIIHHNEGYAKKQLLDLCRNGDDLATAAVYDIVISIGEEGTEPILIQALQSHGDARMAQDFTTSGNAKLEMAGVEWIEENRWKETVKAVLKIIALGAAEGFMTTAHRDLLKSQTTLSQSQINAQLAYQEYLHREIQRNHYSKKTKSFLHPIWGEMN